MHLRLDAVAERARASLFLVPMLGVFLAVALGEAVLAAEDRLGDDATDLPLALTSTVESARAVLVTVAGATISFAGIAFSVSLLVIQLGSSQYSPRVVHTLFRDPFNKRVMGLVVGTFTYCLVVLRSVRAPLESSGEPVIPNLAVALAVVLGIASILAIVAFIDHNAHAMDISEILERVTGESRRSVAATWPTVAEGSPSAADHDVPVGPAAEVRFDRTGWVQQIDGDRLLAAVPEGATVVLDTHPGRYALDGALLCRLYGATAASDTTDDVRSAVMLGDTRTMQQDVSYGLRQLVDVALKALSPGINDPTTAQDAIFHSAAVLVDLLAREPRPDLVDEARRARLIWAQQPTHAELVALAYDEVRRAAAGQPTVCVYLLESLELVADCLSAEQRARCLPLLGEQAELVVAGAERADLLPNDLAAVRSAYARRAEAWAPSASPGASDASGSGLP